ncbi:hypothetical protein G7Y89_g9897 [Cudoniella acicularis]|uniref:Dienelactone hydrolase domain-containing protein n=1 Tax=Cudoniella acicularis TaxID=354080 RepID=A0A8H4RGH4_9HELO|nr:hypothetical protein G7Y89_g9897 [Cudoniella acicularis]
MSCPDCFRGGITTSHPTGTETTIHGLPTYVASPDEGVTPKGIIVFITDAFGWKFVNNRVLSDHYAKKGGFLVYCPDFMDGKPLDPQVLTLMDQISTPSSWLTTLFYKPFWIMQTMLLAIPWKSKASIPITRPRVISFIQALRTSLPPFSTDDLKIGVAGFCWGGKHTVLLAKDDPSSRVCRHESQKNHKMDQRLIDCAFTAHPSYLEVPIDINAITIPISVAVGDEDMALKAPLIRQMKEILEAKEGQNHEVHIMPGAKHGFAVRTHPEDKREMECAEKAEVQAIEWFTRWFVPK